MLNPLSFLRKKEEVTMGRMYGRRIVFLLSVPVLCAVPFMPGICADPDKTEPADLQKMKETIKQQADTIQQLQWELNKQRKSEVKVPEKQPPPDKQAVVEQALRESWGCCGTQSRVLKVTDAAVSICFDNIHDLIGFFDSGAEEHARADHAVFLKATGLERGVIEYYTSDQKKLYSISGSLAEAKVERYY